MFRLGKIKSAAESFLSQYKMRSPASYAAAQQGVGGLLILDGFIGIDNPLGNKKRSGIFGTLIGIVVGLLFVFGTGFIGNLMGINKLTATTSAKVVGVSQPTTTTNSEGSSSSSCTAQAKYMVGGKEYTQAASSGSSSACSLTAGQTININYDPNSPGAWAYDLNTVKAVLKIFPFIGAIVAIISLFTFIIRLLSIIFGWKLLKNGRAMAKTLPAGTDLSAMINEIRQNFAQHLFSFASGNVQPPSQQSQPQVATQPTTVPQLQPPISTLPSASTPLSATPQTQPQPTQLTEQPSETPQSPTNNPQK